MPRFSLVIAVYNVGRHLEECLSSLAGQDFRDWEALCVDDGSTDGSSEVLARWAARDPRVRVIYQENAGVSRARNVGMGSAAGDYLCFVDADDYLVDGALAAMDEECARLGADVVSFGATGVPAEALTPWVARRIAVTDGAVAPFEPKMALGEGASPFVWARAYRRAFLVECGAAFDEGLSLGEDVAFLASFLPHAGCVASSSRVVYAYRLSREGSAMARERCGSPSQLSRHVDVVGSVCAAWDRDGFLDAWPDELASWALRFCGYAILRAGKRERAALAPRLGEALSRYLTSRRREEHPLRRDVGRMVGLFMRWHGDAAKPPTDLEVAATALAWRIREYGLLDLAMRALGRGDERFASSGSGS